MQHYPLKQESPPAGNRTRRTARSANCPGGGRYPSPGRVRVTPVQARMDKVKTLPSRVLRNADGKHIRALAVSAAHTRLPTRSEN